MVGNFKEDESVTIEQTAQLHKHCNSDLPVGCHPSVWALGSSFLCNLNQKRLLATFHDHQTSLLASKQASLDSSVKCWNDTTRCANYSGKTNVCTDVYQSAGMTPKSCIEYNAKSPIIPIASVLESMFKIEISPEEAKKIRKGQGIILNNLRGLKNYDIFCTIVGNVPIAICNFTHGYVKPIRVFNILK